MVKFIESTSEWNSLLSSNPLVIADFTASWCGPCKAISPVFEELSHQHQSDLCFVKVDVDQQNELAAKYGVSAMPTFKVFLQGREIRELRGADRNGLALLCKDSIDFYQTKLQEHQENKSKPVTESREVLLQLPVKQLKIMLQERGQSLAGLAEKVDLVDKLKSL